MKKLAAIFLAALLLPTGFGGTASAAPGDVKFRSLAEIEVAGTDAQGKPTIRRLPAGKVVPGEIVIFTNIFTNAGRTQVENLIVTNPIPEHMEYLEGSASTQPGDELTFSVDGGRSFDQAANLSVRTADGNKRKATAADYTHIRWRLKKPLAVNGEGHVEFRARLK